MKGEINIMAIKIGHASIDEVGGVKGPKTGDQTGKEIFIRTFYKHPWNVYLECTDTELAKKAAAIMTKICNNANYGYSQVNRWQGYNSIKKNNGNIAKGKGDFDCSSLCISCYILAGLKMTADGATGTMRQKLLATGKFKAYTDAVHIGTDNYAKIGGLFLKEGSHVAMALENGPKATTIKKISTAVKKDTTKYVTVNCKSLNVRKDADATTKILAVLTKGTKCEYLGEKNGFYKVKTPKAVIGYINKKYCK
jgi:hypothetical protein